MKYGELYSILSQARHSLDNAAVRSVERLECLQILVCRDETKDIEVNDAHKSVMLENIATVQLQLSDALDVLASAKSSLSS